MLIISKADARHVGALCEVLGETLTRYDVAVLSDGPLPLSVEGGMRGNPHYVTKHNVTATGVTQEMYGDYLATVMGII